MRGLRRRRGQVGDVDDDEGEVVLRPISAGIGDDVGRAISEVGGRDGGPELGFGEHAADTVGTHQIGTRLESECRDVCLDGSRLTKRLRDDVRGVTVDVVHGVVVRKLLWLTARDRVHAAVADVERNDPVCDQAESRDRGAQPFESGLDSGAAHLIVGVGHRRRHVLDRPPPG
jgi:hypothetical protein